MGEGKKLEREKLAFNAVTGATATFGVRARGLAGPLHPSPTSHCLQAAPGKGHDLGRQAPIG